MKVTRPGLQAFQEQVASAGHSVYLKAGEDFATARRLRIIPWVFDGNVIDIMMLQEGWHDKKVKNDKGKEEIKSAPIRFLPGVEIPEGITWSMSQGNAKFKPRKQTPQPQIYFLCYDYKTQEIKLPGFYHKGVIDPITAWMSEKNPDGSDNEAYIEDFTSIDLLIQRIDDKKWSVTTSEKNPKELSKDIIKAMNSFKWDWEAFVRCEAPMEDDAPGFQDWMHLVSNEDNTNAKVEKPAAQEKVETPKSTATESDSSFNWRTVQTPLKAVLGEQSLEDLQKMKDVMDKHKKADVYKQGVVYKGVVAGIAELSQGETVEEDTDEKLF